MFLRTHGNTVPPARQFYAAVFGGPKAACSRGMPVPRNTREYRSHSWQFYASAS